MVTEEEDWQQDEEKDQEAPKTSGLVLKNETLMRVRDMQNQRILRYLMNLLQTQLPQIFSSQNA